MQLVINKKKDKRYEQCIITLQTISVACGHHQPGWAYHLRDINNHWMHTALCDGIPPAAPSSAADDVEHYSVLNGNDQHFAAKPVPTMSSTSMPSLHKPKYACL